jgi:hypothetical protein
VALSVSNGSRMSRKPKITHTVIGTINSRGRYVNTSFVR